MAKGLTYGQFVGAHMDCPQADFRDCIIGGTLTELHDVVAPRLGDLPGDIAAQLRRNFWREHERASDWQEKLAAQKSLASEVETFHAAKLHVAFDEPEIRIRAARWSALCGKMMCLEVMQDFARSVGVLAPEVGKHVTREGAAKRLQCERWWRKAMRRAWTRQAESHLVAAGFVHRHRQVYASDRCVQHRGERKRADREMLQAMVAVSDAGEQLDLWDVVQASQANPTLRRNELMTRLRGFEEIAQENGDVAEFVTLTCPSAFHRTLSNGQKNPKWEGFTPRQGQQWLCKMWARARAKLARISVLFYGFRVAEPHHDGTPHWHMVLFIKDANASTLRTVLRGVWLSEYSSEAGASDIRACFKRIDPAKGSACGYLAKYIAKNIDGYEVGADHETEGQDAADSVDRVSAWASAHGIRQFQQIGGPSVTLWRELRRVRSAVVDNAPVEAARQAADEGEWSGFVVACGGIAAGRKGPIQLTKEHTGELSQYGELKSQEIVGVQSACGSVRTREKVWRIERKPRLDPQAWVRSPLAARSGSLIGRTAAEASVVGEAEQGKTRGTGEVRRHAAVDPVARGESGGIRHSAPLSSLGPVSITVREDESRNRGEGNAWPPWTQ